MARKRKGKYLCNICDKRYIQEMRLITHINNIHNGAPNIAAEAAEVNIETPEPVESTVNTAQETVEWFAKASTPISYVISRSEYDAINQSDNKFAPFSSEGVYQLAKWLITNDISVNAINELLNTNTKIPFKEPVLRELSSNYQLREKVALMVSIEEWKEHRSNHTWHDELDAPPVFYFQRDLIPCLQWLLRGQRFREGFRYAPCRIVSTSGERVYRDMNTGDWWWEMQVNELPG
jgi:hypothetical protein